VRAVDNPSRQDSCASSVHTAQRSQCSYSNVVFIMPDIAPQHHKSACAVSCTRSILL